MATGGHDPPGRAGVASAEAVANADQARLWDGPEGGHWVTHEERYNQAFRRYTPLVLEAAGIAPDGRVLDIGCGCGETTLAAARRAPGGTVLGVDLSRAMLDRARQRSRIEGLTNVRFVRADAQVHPFDEGGFDVAISRFSTMFFRAPAAAFSNIARALTAGGRLAFVSWQGAAHNEWVFTLRGALAPSVAVGGAPWPEVPGPFAQADPERVRATLDAAGFGDISVRAVREPVLLGRDADDALAFVRGMGLVKHLVGDAGKATALCALDSLRARLARHEGPDGVTLQSAAWLVTARAAPPWGDRRARPRGP